ncbi:hypothetical protein AAFX88_003435 [Bacillus cereus]
MSFFDNVKKQEEEQTEISKLENEITQLCSDYVAAYKSLEHSTSYFKKSSNEKEKVISDFKEYFKSRGFQIEHTNNPSAEIIKAYLNQFTVELEFSHTKEFYLNIPKKEYEHITMIDKNEYEFKFQGNLHSDNVQLFIPVKDHTKKTIYSQQIQNLKEDIDFIKNRTSDFYIPDFHLYLNKRDKYVNSIKEYLELIDEELSHKQ